MNKINFQLKDKEKINLSIGMGIKKIYPPLENLEVTPTKEQQVFKHDNSYGYDNVTVKGAPLQNKAVTPSAETQVITSDNNYYGLYEVAVNGDSNLLSENIKDGVEIFGVTGNLKATAPPPKGFSIDKWTSDGYVEEITIFGHTVIPTNYFYSTKSSCLATKLNKITIVDDVTDIRDYAFYGVSQNVHTIVLPDTVKNIGQQCFSGLTRLKTINLPDSVETLGQNAISSCTALELSKLPANLKTIGRNCFIYCEGITIKTIPNGVTNLAYQCFDSCIGITQISMNVTQLGGTGQYEGAFQYCSGLKAVWLGSKISSYLSRYAFKQSTKLQKIYIDLPRATVETFANYQYAFTDSVKTTDIIVCNDDEGFITKAEFDAIDWSIV